MQCKMPLVGAGGQACVLLPPPAGRCVTAERPLQCLRRQGRQRREEPGRRADCRVTRNQPPATQQPGRLHPLPQPSAIVGLEPREDPLEPRRISLQLRVAQVVDLFSDSRKTDRPSQKRDSPSERPLRLRARSACPAETGIPRHPRPAGELRAQPWQRKIRLCRRKVGRCSAFDVCTGARSIRSATRSSLRTAGSSIGFADPSRRRRPIEPSGNAATGASPIPISNRSIQHAAFIRSAPGHSRFLEWAAELPRPCCAHRRERTHRTIQASAAAPTAIPRITTTIRTPIVSPMVNRVMRQPPARSGRRVGGGARGAARAGAPGRRRARRG